MRISAKGEYAIKAMLDLALRDPDTLEPIQDIAKRQSIPQRYLEQVLLGLKRAGFLHSRRGSSGGYRLAKPPAQITVGAVLRAVEGPSGVGGAGRSGRAMPGDAAGDLVALWRAVSEAVDSVVDGTTLEDLRRQAFERRALAKPMYHI
ncbi:MAG TPA: Rrf2 family transcriptional regulator [Methylomirabilota bacterium]|nr:MAG: Rrf2 family transcriptional regulator [Candidatus Rokubacteria bacterium]PYM58180.1 MAG: Rrf2 family transcriptional regulator [Candidatus Rokubacteria bacterium]PYM74066.1 MAG: Rrf2 family transcriptional regulator [Candidatus Rokubacteria bacterium]HYR38598.1 Rrf2 family transcriptional regulator [Methylomirabilota bacterium]